MSSDSRSFVSIRCPKKPPSFFLRKKFFRKFFSKTKAFSRSHTHTRMGCGSP
jgi:hypothetical protein